MRRLLARTGGVCLSLLVSGAALAGAGPVGSGFTYQGVLKQGGSPYGGLADFEFKLFETALGITQIGGTIPINAVSVVDGVFTSSLDFGALAYNGAERWLQIAVRTPAGSANPFVTLAPRQKIESAPYAAYALNAALSGTYASAVNFNNAANAFSGNGAGLTNLNAGNIATGNLATARLAAGGAWALSSDLNLDGNTLVVDAGINSVGVGTATPEAPLHVVDGSAGSVNATSSSLVLERNATNFLTMLAPDNLQTGVRFGQPTLGNNAAALLFNHPFTPGGMVLQVGGFNRMAIDSSGHVSVGSGAVPPPAPPALLTVYEPDETTSLNDVATTLTNAGLLISTDFTTDAFTPGVFWQTTNNNPTRPKAGIYLQTGATGASLHMGTSGAYGVGITNDGIVLNAAGNVGMGTATPEGSGLHVFRGSAGTITANSNSKLVLEDNSNTYMNLLTPDVSESGMLFGRPGSAATSAAGGIVFNNTANADGLQFRTGGNNTRMVLDSTGNLGIGTIAPTGRLHVSGSSGDGTVVLPGSSIGQAEIFAEPGMASRILDTTSNLGTDTFTLVTRNITCPDDGFVIAIGTVGFIGSPLSDKTALVGILTSDASLPADQDYLVKISSYETVTVQTIRAVTAGTHSFFFQAEGLDDGIMAEQRKLSLMYFPTAYGTADVD